MAKPKLSALKKKYYLLVIEGDWSGGFFEGDEEIYWSSLETAE